MMNRSFEKNKSRRPRSEETQNCAPVLRTPRSAVVLHRRSMNKILKEKEETELPDISKITVVLRMRPFDSAEEGELILRSEGTTVAINVTGSDKVYSFADVFGPEASQQEVYEKTAFPLIRHALDGYNVCIFAYGSTGTGKTYTLSGNAAQRGIIPRFCNDLFCALAERQGEKRVAASFYEIYQEKVYDLLAEGRTPLRVRGGDTPYLEGLKEVEVESTNEFENIWHMAWMKRVTAATAVNDTSSRSHAIVHFKYGWTSSVELTEGLHEHVTSNVYFVDLAGSERISFVGTAHINETVSINSSLSVLHGVIISKLNKMRPNFRDSVLTRLLRDCFGENSRTTMIATVIPTARYRNEIRSTLEFAAATAGIQQTAFRNIDPVAVAMKNLKDENEALKLRLSKFSSSRSLTAFTLPKAPSVVELQPDPSMNSWEPIVKEITYSAFNFDSAAVGFLWNQGQMMVQSLEEGVYVNGQLMEHGSSIQVAHGDRIVLRGQRIFIAFLIDKEGDVMTKNTFHSAKLEYFEKNHERFRAKLEEQARRRAKADSAAIGKELEQDITDLQKELNECGTILSPSNENKSKAMSSDYNEKKEQLENCIALQETFMSLSDEAVNGLEVSFDSEADRSKALSLKISIASANFFLEHFGKQDLYEFSLVMSEESNGIFEIRIDDKKNSMFAIISREEFENILATLDEQHLKYTVPEEGFETVGELMFNFCRSVKGMARIGGGRMSAVIKTALYNSTVDAARRRQTTVEKFRRSISVGRRSTFGMHYANALGSPHSHSNDDLESQFVRSLVNSFNEDFQGIPSSVSLYICCCLSQAKMQLPVLNSVQRGAIRKGVGLINSLHDFMIIKGQLEAAISVACGVGCQNEIGSCAYEFPAALKLFHDSCKIWVKMLQDPEEEVVFASVGTLCLQNMEKTISKMTICAGKLSLFLNEEIAVDSIPTEVREDFVAGRTAALSEIKEEAEELFGKFGQYTGLCPSVAQHIAELLIQMCNDLMKTKIYVSVNPICALLKLARDSANIYDGMYGPVERRFAARMRNGLRQISLGEEKKNVIEELLHMCDEILDVRQIFPVSTVNVRKVLNDL